MITSHEFILIKDCRTNYDFVDIKPDDSLFLFLSVTLYRHSVSIQYLYIIVIVRYTIATSSILNSTNLVIPPH
jgi:hypothetical protein